MKIFFNNPGTGSYGVRFSVPEMDDLRDRSGVFEQVSAACRGSMDFTERGHAQRLEELLVSPSYFDLVGVAPERGRLFGPEEKTLGYAPVVVISDSFFRRALGADPRVLGRTIHLDNDPYSVIGVLPPGFRHPGRARPPDVDVWITTGFSAPPDPPPTRSTRSIPQAYGRLRRGVTIATAQDRLTAMAAELRLEHPGDYPPEGKWTIEIQPLQEALVGKTRPVLLVLQGAVLLIILIVSLNIAGLLLARGVARQQEMAVRSALGASRGRIVGQVLTESLVLAGLGGGSGLGAALVALKILEHAASLEIPRLSEVRVDWPVLAFALLISLFTGLVFALAPVIHSVGGDLGRGITNGAQGPSHSRRTVRLRDALIVSELAIAVVLLIGGGLLVRTLRGLLRENPGFATTEVVTASVTLPFPTDPRRDAYLTAARQSVFYWDLLRRMDAIPGVERAGLVSDVPAAGIPLSFTLSIEGRPSRTEDNLRAEDILVSPDYFKVMQATLLRGRPLTEEDRDGTERVAIVDESTARRYWPSSDPLGRRLRVGQGRWLTIVGVVKDMKHDGLDVDGIPHVYVPIYQDFDPAEGVVFRDFAIVLRTSLPASTLAPLIRHEVEALDPTLPVYRVASMGDLLDASLASRRFSAELVGGFACLALVIAAIGVYGLLAYLVSQKSREISLRIALGASRGDVLKMFVGRGLALAGGGILLGLVVAASATSLMGSLLYGVRPHDPVVFLVMPMVLFVVAGVASYLPARRATRADPARALRDA